MKPEDIVSPPPVPEEYRDKLEGNNDITEPTPLTDEDLQKIQIRDGVWKQEAKQIPLDLVEPREAQLLTKAINDVPLLPGEQEELNNILKKYRPAIYDIEPDRVVETYKENKEFVDAKNEFINLAETYDDIETITMNYKFDSKHTKTYKFDIHPLEDSRAIIDIQHHLDVFQDFTQDELLLWNKEKTGEALTREEMVVVEGLNRRVNEIAQRDEIRIARQYLAMCVSFHGEPLDYEGMLEVFEHMKPLYVTALFSKVQGVQQVGTEHLEEVFPETD